ncbi:hypothetical protein H1P_2030010 [Hyella patelloides LEGE 07179]|uniref:Protein kinase domain-containing protein n=1 Tax=Hyella patelloides LEGE 07179 TaxID=945734 RepID=A0A563VQC0_9CYAN|nr:hypothetical protein [Hyella patelloides]VEP13565.1 hypothetical protein H1P_2030010 [Hyella patelloides LEGE 07179]
MSQGYAPTEQARGRPRLNSDIYALGTIGIQALTGVSPIYLEEDGEGEVIWQNRAKVSPQLATILTNMVCYHFKDRYQSATEALQALNSLNNKHQHNQSTSSATQVSSEFTPEPKPKEIKMPLENNPWIPWNQEAVPKTKLEKIALDSKQQTLKVASRSKSRQKKISLSTEQLNAKAVAQPQLKKNKVAFKSEPITSEITADRQKKDSSAYLDVLSAVLENINLSYTSIFITLKKSRLLIGAGVASISICIFAGYIYLNHRKSYLQSQRTLKQIEQIKVAQKYSECVEQAQIFPSNHSDLNTQLETLLLECRQGEAQEQLTQAKKLAEQSKLQDAIALTTQISQDMNAYSEAQKLIADWSEKIFQIASNKYHEGQLEAAKAIANAVPTTSSLKKKIETKIQQWDEEWQQDRTHLQTARQKLDEHRRQDAINSAQKVSDNAYQQKQSQQIIKKAQAEIAAVQATAEEQDNNPSPQSVPRTNSHSHPIAPLFPDSILRSRLKRASPYSSKTSPSRSLMSPGSRSKSFVCLNNPNPKCRK